MRKTILITGATDGIGLATAARLQSQGHAVLLHGRSTGKLAAAERRLEGLSGKGQLESFLCDLARLDEVEAMANAIADTHDRLDVVINNAGVFKTTEVIAPGGIDVRFVVNTIAPYLLTRQLLPLLDAGSRVVNLSSAAQSPVDLQALAGRKRIADNFSAYAQSKLALTMWSRAMAESVGASGPVVIAVNPGSMLGTKMVREGFGVAGADIGIGAEIVAEAATSERFANASGQYFDNDAGRFAPPHLDARDRQKCARVVEAIEGILARRE